MRRNFQNYIFIALSKQNDEWKWVAIKTNKQGKVMKLFGEQEDHLPFPKRLQQFVIWIGDITESQLVAFGHEFYHTFLSEIEHRHSNVFPKHLVRMMKAQFWNMESECKYRFRIKHPVSLQELLFLYKQDYMNHPNPLMQECVNLLTLTNFFLFDKAQTQKIMKMPKEEVIQEIYKSYTAEELLFLFMEKGYQVSMQYDLNQKIELSIKQEDYVIQQVSGKSLNELLVRLAVQFHKKRFQNQ